MSEEKAKMSTFVQRCGSAGPESVKAPIPIINILSSSSLFCWLCVSSATIHSTEEGFALRWSSDQSAEVSKAGGICGRPFQFSSNFRSQEQELNLDSEDTDGELALKAPKSKSDIVYPLRT